MTEEHTTTEDLKRDLAIIDALKESHENVTMALGRLPLFAFHARRELVDEMRGITEALISLSSLRHVCSQGTVTLIADAFNKAADEFSNQNLPTDE